ncbi:hypothetical protein AeRB84_006315 [Aphanomyces euteiches]|nr:hypothetical protein AeRB84_006315 [Aphanomyces euteiches]
MTPLNIQFAATLLGSFLDSVLQDDILEFKDVYMDVSDAIVDMLSSLALPIVVEPTMPAMEPRFLQESTTDACAHDDMADVPHIDLLNASFDEDWHLEDQDVALLQGIFDLDASTPAFATMQDPTVPPKQAPRNDPSPARRPTRSIGSVQYFLLACVLALDRCVEQLAKWLGLATSRTPALTHPSRKGLGATQHLGLRDTNPHRTRRSGGVRRRVL